MDLQHNNSNRNIIMKKLKLISINVNSIVKNQRRALLMQLIKAQNPNVIFLTKTKLNNTHIIKFKDYNIIRNDRNVQHIGGGTEIIIKKQFKYNEACMEHLKNQLLESTVIKLNMSDNNVLSHCSIR